MKWQLIGNISGKNGADGADGANGVSVKEIQNIVEEKVSDRISRIEIPHDGKDADLNSVKEIVADAVAKAVSDLPTPRNGDPGRDGENGKSVSAEDLAPMVADVVAKAVEGLPAAKDGRDGKDAAPVDVDSIIKSVLREIRQPADGRDGADGKSFSIEDVRQLLESAVAHQALEFERRNADLLQRTIEDMRQKTDRAIAAIPVPKDGRDGIDFDTLEIEQSDDLRVITFSIGRGENIKKKTIQLAALIDRGVWRHESKYTEGDGVSFSGAFWIAQKDHPGKPKEDLVGWRRAVNRGNDGRDGKDGKDGNYVLP